MSQREPRQLDPGYLAWLKTQPCCACKRSFMQVGPSDPAHLKAGNVVLGKPWAGTAKPDDKWATALCRSCHDRQHAHGDELGWWSAHGIDPFKLAARLYARYRRENPKAPAPHVRKQRPVKKRKPRDQRTKIRSRNDLRRLL